MDVAVGWQSVARLFTVLGWRVGGTSILDSIATRFWVGSDDRTEPTPHPMSLWAVTVYFNPGRFRARIRNYRCFRHQLHVPLLTLEWSDQGDFQLGDDEADLLVRLSGGDLMWQKERLLGIAVSHLPDDCEAVLLIDADILLPGDNWPERLLQQLSLHPVVQPFQEVHHLSPLPEHRLISRALMETPDHHRPFYLARQSFADHCLQGARTTAAPTVTLDLVPEQMQEVNRLGARPSFGHAWAVRRDLIERVGLYEHCVAGSGDLAFAMAVAGRAEWFCLTYPLNGAQQSHYLSWAAGAELAAGPGRIGRLDDVALHLFHGHLSRRSYRSRLEALSASGFDPARDLLAAPGRPFSWDDSRSSTGSLRPFFKSYFQKRAEDADPAVRQERTSV